MGAISSRIYQPCPCCWVVLVSVCQKKAFMRLCLWFRCCYRLKLAFILKYLVSRWSKTKLAKQEGKAALWDRKAACGSGELSSAPAVGSACPAQVWAGSGGCKEPDRANPVVAVA